MVKLAIIPTVMVRVKSALVQVAKEPVRSFQLLDIVKVQPISVLLNRVVFTELVLESIPQMIIQGINCTWLDGWGVVSIISFSFSALMLMKLTAKFVYWMFYHEQPLSAVPTGIDANISNPVFGGDLQLQSHEHYALKR